MRLLPIILLAGCASLNTFRYTGNEVKPFMVERAATEQRPINVNSNWSWDTIAHKDLTVNNPLNTPISVQVYCTSMTQGDLNFDVPPKSSRVFTVDSTFRHKYDESCTMEWSNK
jgi:hypothetical protein